VKKLFVLAVSLPACLLPAPDVGDLHPGTAVTDAGDAQQFTCDNSDSDPQIDVSFSRDLRPLMLRSPGGCFPCHLSRATSGLDVSSYALFRRGGTNTGASIIIDFDPCNSVLLKKIGRTPPFGSRMPLAPPHYTNEEQLLFRDWIAEGARNN
jgi:hypothetical protein